MKINKKVPDTSKLKDLTYKYVVELCNVLNYLPLEQDRYITHQVVLNERGLTIRTCVNGPHNLIHKRDLNSSWGEPLTLTTVSSWHEGDDPKGAWLRSNALLVTRLQLQPIITPHNLKDKLPLSLTQKLENLFPGRTFKSNSPLRALASAWDSSQEKPIKDWLVGLPKEETYFRVSVSEGVLRIFSQHEVFKVALDQMTHTKVGWESPYFAELDPPTLLNWIYHGCV